jgi:hypothetical protein
MELMVQADLDIALDKSLSESGSEKVSGKNSMIFKEDLKKKNLSAQGMKLDDYEKLVSLVMYRQYQPNEIVMEEGASFEGIFEVSPMPFSFFVIIMN